MAAHVSAAVPYQSYTYTYYAQPIHSPDAYAPEKEYPGTYFDELGFKDPADLFVTDDGEIFVADAGNNRVVVLNSDMTFKAQIVDYPNFEDETDPITMKNPGGIFVTGDGDIYIADTGNGRILILDKEYKLKEILGAPESDIFPDGFVFTPNSLAVDKSGRIYVVVNNSNMGILALKSDGSFESFVGAQKVNPSMSDLIWRVFMTEEQIERTKKFVPTEYNNIAIDSRDFVYVTSSAIEQWNQYAAAISRSKDSQYAPVKMFNPSGVDVLKRTGFFPPAGDIQVEFGSDDSYGPSQITDVAVGPYGTYSLVDSRRNKIFTYDADGNLLIAFSGKGMQTGLFQSISSIAYQGDKILALDKVRNSITVFATTDYGKLLYSAIDLHDRRKFQDEAKVWESILMANSNNEMAYTGMATP